MLRFGLRRQCRQDFRKSGILERRIFDSSMYLPSYEHSQKYYLLCEDVFLIYYLFRLLLAIRTTSLSSLSATRSIWTTNVLSAKRELWLGANKRVTFLTSRLGKARTITSTVCTQANTSLCTVPKKPSTSNKPSNTLPSWLLSKNKTTTFRKYLASST